MDGAEASPVVGAWASIRGYLTPATLFLVVNLVIGTIALTSRSHHQRRRRRQGDHEHLHGEVGHQEMLRHFQPPQHQQEEMVYAPTAPLARTSSVLDRLRSFGLYRFRSGDFPPEYNTAAVAVPSHTEDVISPMEEMKQPHYASSRSEPTPAQEDKKAASRLRNSSSEVMRAEQDLHYQEEYVPPPAPASAPLARTSSVLDRLRSFSLYRFRSGDLAQEDITSSAPAQGTAATSAASDDKKQAAHYGRSQSEPAREQNKKAKNQATSEAKMTKSSSEARKEAAAPSIAEEADDGVDARADDFINNFRKQLQLQRLNSLLNYKEMLNRGGGGEQ
ncbi:hypothetical protein GUJ93_ZPchr0010g7267 [Zizania palustris]|uniref:DUF4408 domain-containing protein n=1 Tax=Zizania palustris TaxID=103762 RepID=A0A8J5WBK7_ZIZPA|nr:hypothetical protein GUJ93_ZPchr0010g7267 [Zizania palustris]